MTLPVFCKNNDVLPKSKRLKEHMFDRDDFFSFSLKYFCEVLKSLPNHRKEVIRKFGFSCLLFFKKSDILSVFVRWFASCVDIVSSQIIVDDCKVISISKEYVFTSVDYRTAAMSLYQIVNVVLSSCCLCLG